jgi:hypothetical protein
LTRYGVRQELPAPETDNPGHSAPYAIFLLVALAIVAGGFALGLDPVIAGSDRVRRCIEPVVLLIATTAAAILCVTTRAPAGFLLRDWTTRAAWPLVGATSLVALAATAVAARYVFNEYPMSGDEYAYIFQSRIFELGRVWIQPWPLERYFDTFFIFNAGGKLITQYPPGWPAVLAAASTIGIANWLVNPILGAGTIAILYLLGLRRYGAATGLLTVCIFAGSGFFVLNSATFFCHPVTAFWGVLFVLAASEYLEHPRVVSGIGAGVTLAAVAVTRHYDAVLFALPALAALVWRSSWAHWRLVPLVVISGLPLIVALLAYYWAITGDPLLTPMTLLDPGERLLGPKFNMVQSTETLLGRGIELAEWTSAPFLAVYIWALVRRACRGELHFFEFYGLIFPLGYWLYWGDAGLRWGPRYIYSAFPFVALTAAAAICDALRERNAGRLSRVAARAGILSIVISIVQIPFLAINAGKIADQFEDLYRQVARAGIHHALVFVSSGTGEIWHQPIGNLVRNGLSLDDDVIYAHAGDRMADQTNPTAAVAAISDLHAAFSDRKIWVYQRKEGDTHGRLTEWKPT